MIFKVFIASVLLLVIAGLAFGIKALFYKNANLPSGSCKTNQNSGDSGCSCSTDACCSSK